MFTWGRLWKTDPLRDYHIYGLNNLLQTARNRILVLNVHYTTKKALVEASSRDGADRLLQGVEESQEHIFRFETYSDKLDWTLTDIDHSLKGNDFYSNN